MYPLEFLPFRRQRWPVLAPCAVGEFVARGAFKVFAGGGVKDSDLVAPPALRSAGRISDAARRASK